MSVLLQKHLIPNIMTNINCKLLTTSTTVIEGVSGNYTLKTISHTIDPRIKRPINRVLTFQTINDLARELASELTKTLTVYYQEGHIFNITIKDFETPKVQ